LGGQWYHVGNAANWTSSSSTFNINVNVVSIGGTVKRNGTLLSAGGIAVLESLPTGSDISDVVILGTTEITAGGTFSMLIKSGVSTGYIGIMIESGANPEYYVTPNKVNLSGSMNLDVKDMTKFNL
jgi:hypothetical protein